MINKFVEIDNFKFSTRYEIDSFVEKLFFSNLRATQEHVDYNCTIDLFNADQDIKKLEANSFTALEKIVRFIKKYNSENESQIRVFSLEYKVLIENKLNSVYCTCRINTTSEPEKIFYENFYTDTEALIDCFIKEIEANK